MSRAITSLSVCLAILASVVTFGIMLYAGEPSSIEWWFAALFFAAWGVSPYACLAIISVRVREKGVASLVSLIGVCALAGFGLYAYLDGFFVHLDAQNGLLFVFIPFLQWVGCVLVGAICLVAFKLQRSPNQVTPGKA